MTESSAEMTSAGREAPPLDGLLVLDLGHLVAGPMVGSILGDFGARVIKIERPGQPDPHRRAYQKEGIGLWARVDYRNKEAITLDLKSTRGKELFTRLVEQADILVENFLPGVIERLGFGPEEVWETTNPGLIFCRISGWGQTGPRSSRRGYGRTGEAGSGFAYLNGEPDGPPMHSAVSLGDTVAALWGAFGVVMAIQTRARDGKGQVVDVGLYEGLLRMIVHQIIVQDQLGRTLTRMGNQNPGVPTVNVYKTRDGGYFSVSNATVRTQEKFFELVGVAGDPELGTVEGIENGNRDRFHAHVREWMLERDLDEVDRLFHEAGAVGTPVWSAADLIDDPHALAREMIIEVADEHFGTVRMPGVVPKLSRTPGRVVSSGQETGASNAQIFEELLGIDAAELAALEADGVV